MDNNTKVQNYYAVIVQCLIQYGGLKEAEAWRLVNESKVIEVKNEADRKWLFHEIPYYWAMTLLPGNSPQWYLDPALWPPSEDHYDWLKEWIENNE